MSPEIIERPVSGFRVWIAACPASWKPVRWSDLPPQARAVRPLGEALFTYERAADLVEGFNRVMLRNPDRVWAVAVPASIRFEEAASPGEEIQAAAVRFARTRIVHRPKTAVA